MQTHPPTPQTQSIPRLSKPFRASSHAHHPKAHLLISASGSVATIKLPLILQALSHHPQLSIRVVLTSSATHFLQGQSDEQPHLSSLAEITNVEAFYRDEDEWIFWDEGTDNQQIVDGAETDSGPTIRGWKRNDPILHIELRRWADLMLVVPLSANTLAKITGGFADNLLTEVVRAWDTDGSVDEPRFTSPTSSSPRVSSETHHLITPEMKDDGCVLAEKIKRILVAPAMNTAMWLQPITKKQIRVLEEEWGVEREDGRGSRDGWFEVLRPVSKEIACGDVGGGAMMEWRDIVRVVERRLGLVDGVGWG